MEPSRRRTLRAAAAPAGLALAALALWLSLPDKTFVFDGVMFAQTVERASEDWLIDLVNPRHMVFSPVFQRLRDALLAAGITVGAYRLFQVVNSCIGAAGLILFGGLVRRLTRDDTVAWGAALLLGATLCYGTRATEGQVYMLMSVGTLATLWAGARLIERPGAGRVAALAAVFVVATLFHSANGFLFPAAAAACWCAFPGRRWAGAASAAAIAALVLVPFLLVFGGAGHRAFLASAAEYHGTSAGFWSGIFRQFWSGASPASRLVTVWRETGAALAVMPPAARAAAGAALWGGALLTVRSAWPRLDARRRGFALLLATAWAGFTVVNLFWPGGLFFYVPAHACLLGLIALGSSPRLAELAGPARRRRLAGLVFAGLTLGAWNAFAGLRPQSRIANNAGYRTALWVADHTVASSTIVITGLGFANSKVYLGAFAHRGREVLEYFLNRRPKSAALREIADAAARRLDHGAPLYALSDLVDSPSTAAEMKRLWGVDPAEVEHALGPGRFVLVAAGPDEKVYLRVPDARRAELFAGLGFSLLTESDLTRYNEHRGVLEEIAREMPPTQRRRAMELMKTKDWGFDLVVEGLSGSLNDSSRAELPEKRARFAEFQRTAEFWKRVGNLAQVLGLPGETTAAWTRAYELSHEDAILEAVRGLKAGQ